MLKNLQKEEYEITIMDMRKIKDVDTWDILKEYEICMMPIYYMFSFQTCISVWKPLGGLYRWREAAEYFNRTR